jgi:phosphatidylglycerophosphatase A
MPVIKESSDALTPPVVTHAFIERAPRRRRAGDYVALAVASCGVGYMPVAPGTWGSGVGLAIYLAFGVFVSNFFPLPSASAENVAGIDAVSNLLQVRESAHLWQTTAYLLLVTVVVLVGIWAATRAEPLLGRKDPGVVVVDEVAGQLITFLFVPAGAPWWLIAAGFVTFRVFDIWKPYPIRRLEALESGLGIMADDVLAGAYGATLMALLVSIYLLL